METIISKIASLTQVIFVIKRSILKGFFQVGETSINGKFPQNKKDIHFKGILTI